MDKEYSRVDRQGQDLGFILFVELFGFRMAPMALGLVFKQTDRAGEELLLGSMDDNTWFKYLY